MTNKFRLIFRTSSERERHKKKWTNDEGGNYAECILIINSQKQIKV